MTISHDLPEVFPYIDVETSSPRAGVVVESDLPAGASFRVGAVLRLGSTQDSEPTPLDGNTYVSLEDTETGERLLGLPVGTVGDLTRYQVMPGGSPR